MKSIKSAWRIARGLRAFVAARSILSGVSRPVYFDVGACGGVSLPWELLVSRNLVDAYFFDLAPEWSGPSLRKRVLRKVLRLRDLPVVPVGVGGSTEERDVFLTENPGCSSVLEPDATALERWAARRWFHVDRVQRVRLYSLQDIIQSRQLPPPDMLKLDVQGLDLDCVKGLGGLIENLSAIELESHFYALYKGQATFSSILSFMTAHGFVLRDLHRQGPFDGDYVEANAFWVRCNPDDRQSRIIRAWETVNRVNHGEDFIR